MGVELPWASLVLALPLPSGGSGSGRRSERPCHVPRSQPRRRRIAASTCCKESVDMKTRIARKIEKRLDVLGSASLVPYNFRTVEKAERRLRRKWARRNRPSLDGRRGIDSDWYRANRLDSILIRLQFFPRIGGRRVYRMAGSVLWPYQNAWARWNCSTTPRSARPLCR